MYRKKVYGQSKVELCPFCSRTALAVNKQGIPVCKEHIKKTLELRCICGEYLDIRNGKYGPYFFCLNCGNISFKKGISMNLLK